MKKKNIAEKLFETISRLERMKQGGEPEAELEPEPEAPERDGEEEAPAGTAPGSDGEGTAPERDDAEAALAALGRAFIERIGVPEGMTEAEAALSIVAMWNEKEAQPAAEGAERGEKPVRLPEPLTGGLADAPESDYDSMSAEQFRRLTKQLRRASRDGRKIRL